MSSAAAGWYVDPSTGTNLRYWSGSTWTDEVAPLPHEPTQSGPVDLFAPAVTAESPAEKAAEPGEATPEPAEAAQTESEPMAEPASDALAGEGAVAQSPPLPDLDADVERTRLTRRELRARRGGDPQTDDTPRHLPPMAPPAAPEAASEPPEAVEIPAVPAETEAQDVTVDRRRRIIRMSVLLGILAVTTSVAVLTAGTL